MEKNSGAETPTVYYYCWKKKRGESPLPSPPWGATFEKVTHELHKIWRANRFCIWFNNFSRSSFRKVWFTRHRHVTENLWILLKDTHYQRLILQIAVTNLKKNSRQCSNQLIWHKNAWKNWIEQQQLLRFLFFISQIRLETDLFCLLRKRGP